MLFAEGSQSPRIGVDALYSPPGPKFDADEANRTAHYDVYDRSFATIDLGMSGHSRLEHKRAVVQLSGDENRSFRLGFCRIGNDGRDGSNTPFEGAKRISLRFEHHSLSEFHVGDFLFRNGALDCDRVHGVDLGDEVAFPHGLAYFVLELVGGDDPVNWTGDGQELELVLEVAPLDLQTTEFGGGSVDLLLAAASEQELHFVVGFLHFLGANAHLLLGPLELSF